MNDRVPPHSLDIEESLLGAMLLSSQAIEAAVEVCEPGDFYSPANAIIYEAIVRLFKSGDPTDPVTVNEQLRTEGMLATIGGPGHLVTLQINTPSTTSAGRFARTIVSYSGLRRVITIADEAIDGAFSLKELEDVMDALKDGLSSIDLPVSTLPDGLSSVDEFMARDEVSLPPWVIPGLMRVGCRAMLVAEEGAGKSLVAQQLALAGAQGVHPFSLATIPRFTSLLVDLENPDERVMSGFRMVTRGLPTEDYQVDQAWLWHRPAGINIRKRSDRGQLEAVIAKVRPQLICIGPMYKMYRVSGRESDEQAAGEVMAILDDLRTRYGFAIFMEHHAPKKQAGFRDLAPYGSSLWLRWPEFGLSLVRDTNRNRELENNHYLLSRFRMDRVDGDWPDGLSKSPTGLPWEARWDSRFTPPQGQYQSPNDEEEPF